jgi:hypothetical protein
MTDPRRQAYLPYVRQLADMMGLKDWVIEIDDDPPFNAGAIATARICEGRKNLILDLSSSFLEKEDDRPYQRHTIVHELVHCHLGQMNEVLRQMLDADQFAIHRINMEFTTDGIAEAWAARLPLVTSPPKKTGDYEWEGK